MGTRNVKLVIGTDLHGRVLEVDPNPMVSVGDIVVFAPAEGSFTVNGAEVGFDGIDCRISLQREFYSARHDRVRVTVTFMGPEQRIIGGSARLVETGEGNGEVANTSVSEFYARQSQP